MERTPYGKERHLIKRHQLVHYLTVYNRNTLQKMGNIGNISCNGLMLISNLPILVGTDYNMRIILPNGHHGHAFLDFDARCHWCKPGITADHFDSGYSIFNASYDLAKLVNALKHYFSFHAFKKRV